MKMKYRKRPNTVPSESGTFVDMIFKLKPKNTESKRRKLHSKSPFFHVILNVVHQGLGGLLHCAH